MDRRLEGGNVDDVLSLLAPERSNPIHENVAILRSKIGKPAFTTAHGMLIDGQTKFLTHRLPASFATKYPEIEILLMTDVQFGHVCCRADKVKEYNDWTLEKPYRFQVWGGDMVDAWRVGSPGSGYDNILSPQNQLYRFCELMAPVVHRVMGCVGGNHERRAMAGGLDLGSLISAMLGIPYSAGVQMISVEYGKHNPFRGYLWHGRGAARTAGGRVNMTLSVVPNDIDAQVYWSGHIHTPHVYPGWHVRRDHKNQKMVGEKYYVVSASSFLEFYGNYAEIGGYTYTGLMMPLTHVRADGGYRVEM